VPGLLLCSSFLRREGRYLNGRSVRDVFGHLGSLGYDGCFVSAGHLLPIPLFEEAVHQRRVEDRFCLLC